MLERTENYPNTFKPKIVHIGFGAFHRAHQALYAHELAAQTVSDWGYCEISLFGGEELIDNLRKQTHLFNVVEKGSTGNTVKQVHSVCESLHLSMDGHESIIDKMAHPDVAIISITITEKGYGIDLQTGRLDKNHPFIRADLISPLAPKSAIGCIVQALKQRKEKGHQPLSVMSCDNMPENGKITRNAVIDFAFELDSELACWIEENISFPSTMVDRIVPAMTEESHAELDSILGYSDPCGIICEPFRQWVIEDNFVAGRPQWEKVGVELVEDVLPFEEMKLRMLNGSHSFLAYLGYLAGYAHISDCMEDGNFKRAAYTLMMNEQAPTLSMPEGVDLGAYAQSLIDRYSNDNIKHRTWQIAMDGSQKLPQRLLESVSWHLENKTQFPLIALAVAAWMKYVSGVDENGHTIDVKDPIADELKKISNENSEQIQLVKSFINVNSIFGEELPHDSEFIKTVAQAYQQLVTKGAKQAVADALVFYGDKG